VELKILQKMYDLILYIYPVLVQFPKSEKFAMVAEIKNTCFEILKLITRANKEKQKLEHLRQLDASLELLRTQVRLSVDLKFIPTKKYEVISRHLAEVGKMLGGWIRSSNINNSRAYGIICL